MVIVERSAGSHIVLVVDVVADADVADVADVAALDSAAVVAVEETSEDRC